MFSENDAAFIKQFEGKVESTIKEYGLLGSDDKVMVAVSGGKDSTTVLYILKKLGYRVEGMIIDQLLGEYSKKNLSNIKGFCEKNNIKLHVVHMRDEYGCSVCYIKSVLDDRGIRMNQCSICGVIRRSILNRNARELKATKIATGHNLDDETQTVFMNMLQGDVRRSARLGPQTGLTKNRKFVPRIKPLYFCLEAETERYSRLNSFPVVYESCPCSVGSFRSHLKRVLNDIEADYPGIKRSIIDSFLEMLPLLKETQTTGTIGECSLCGEPSSNKICRVCSIICTLMSSQIAYGARCK